MDSMVQIRSWRQMWNDYVYEGIKKGAKQDEIRRNLVEAFRKEIFGQMMFALKVEDLSQAIHTPENEQKVVNLTKNTKKKWMRLVEECRKYPETRTLIRESDLTLEDTPNGEDGYLFAEAKDPEESRFEYDEMPDPDENYVSPWDGDERTAEWPEIANED